MITTIAIMAAAHASSHREAPAISLDPSADLTDFYAFVSPEDASKLVLIANVSPLEAPGGGPNFHRFDDDVLYMIHCDNEGDGEEDISFAFDYTTTYNYPDEFLYNLGDISDPTLINQTQTYDVTMWMDGVPVQTVSGATVAPTNVGVVSDGTGGYTPEATSPGAITSANITSQGTLRTFAGPRQEGFYVDLERTFDLLNLAGIDNANTLLGYNVHSMAVEVPISDMTKDGQPASAVAENEVIACWAATSRRRGRKINGDGTQSQLGPYEQVARLGNPLVNEVVLPVSQKDIFNASHPRDDTQFLSWVTNPILPIYMELILGVTDPVSHDEGLGFGGREDLVLAFLTGHTALTTQPGSYALGGAIPGEPGKVFGAFEALRINLTTPNGWPNGRLVGDDVVDTALSAMAGLLIDGSVVPDGVDSAGLSYLTTFPFLGDPWAGDDHPNGGHDLP